MNRLRGPTHKGGERVKDSVLRLMGTIVEVPVKDRHGNRATKHMTLLSDTTTTDDEGNPTGEVTYSFSKGMREILQQSQHWGRIKAYVAGFEQLLAMRSQKMTVIAAELAARERKGRLTIPVRDFAASIVHMHEASAPASPSSWSGKRNFAG
jgi:hypothetical protein